MMFKSKKRRLKLENSKKRINPKFPNNPLRCGRHCVHFWADKDYFSTYCEDFGCQALTDEEFMMKWDWSLDYAYVCPIFKKGIADPMMAQIPRYKGDRKWLMNLLYKRGSSKSFQIYREKVENNENKKAY